MSATLRVRPTLLRELGKIAAKSDQDVSELAEDALRQFVRSHRETAHLTSTKANARRPRSAPAALEAGIDRLVEDIPKHPFAGIGKPEPLRYEWSGYWSRRITGEHRLVYRVEGNTI